MTAHRLVVARIGSNAQSGECVCGAKLIAARPLSLNDVLQRHCERVARREEARSLVQFIDAHGGRLAAFRGYRRTSS